MKRLVYFLPLLILGCSGISTLQKSKLLTVSNLIETARFSEAKEVVEEMIVDRESSKWPRTWYYRGVLCQTAYLEGVKRNDKSLSELYPDQLYLALESYEKALALEKGGRLDRQIAPMYVSLANEFQKTGEQHFHARRYSEALRAFEKALKISESPILEVETDNNLVFNSGLAAYESRDWEKAINYLGKLHKKKYSANATHLLFLTKLETADTTAAKRVLNEGIENYRENEEFVLLLTDLYFTGNETEKALQLLDQAASRDSLNAKYPFTKGLVYHKNAQYTKAIEEYLKAHRIAPGNYLIQVNIAASYFNTGVEIDEKSRTIMNSRLVQEEKAKSAAAYGSAVEWLDKVYGSDTTDQEILLQAWELYKALRMTDKMRGIESRLR